MQSLLLRPSLQWLCLLLFFMSVSIRATPEEGDILLDWRNNMTHSGVELANWGAAGSSDPCGSSANWSHVSCNNSEYVQQLDLDSLGLSGTLAPELGLLSKLQALSLYNNSFYGSIPEEMGNLSTLVILNLSGNQLSGPIPNTFAKLMSLQYLYLDSNKFSGTFPESLTRLPGVSIIDLEACGLEGPLVPELGGLSKLYHLDLNGNNLDGTIPKELGNLSSLETLDLSDNQFSGPIPETFWKLQNLMSLDLKGNNLDGTIPEELGNLSSLGILDLSDNQFSGSIPETFWKLQNLSYLGLNNNNLSGSFPESLLRDFQLWELNLENNAISGILNYTHLREIVIATAMINPNQLIVNLRNNLITNVISMPHDFDDATENIDFRLEGNPVCLNSTKLEDYSRCFCEGGCIRVVKKSQHLAIIIATTSISIILLFATSLIGMFKRHAKLKLHKLQVEYQNKFVEFEVNPQPFLYNDLRFATQDFNETTKLGQGSFGTVYKGMLSSGNVVAIKKLELKGATYGEIDDFLNEVVFITKMKHRNLVNLKGYCMRGKERMLVYEYVENMDVEHCLLKGQKKETMTWHVRFNICLGVAQGLHYLHTYAEPRVIHRDIKASNILLDAQYVPKIADFGLALLFPDDKTHISTAIVAGTRGYLAPEYVMYGQLSEKADVYSFGVLCLEVISGRRNIDHSMSPNKVYLPSWAWILYDEGKLKDLIDPSMHLSNDEEMEVLQLISVVLSCLQQNPDRRPSMNDVQTALQGKLTLELFSNEMVKSSVMEDVFSNEMVESSVMEDLELESLTSCVGYKNDVNGGSTSRDSTLCFNESEIVSQHSKEKL